MVAKEENEQNILNSTISQDYEISGLRYGLHISIDPIL